MTKKEELDLIDKSIEELKQQRAEAQAREWELGEEIEQLHRMRVKQTHGVEIGNMVRSTAFGQEGEYFVADVGETDAQGAKTGEVWVYGYLRLEGGTFETHRIFLGLDWELIPKEETT